MIEVTEEDVLCGWKLITVPKRDQTPVQITCKALSWAASCHVMAMGNPAEGMIHALLNGLPKEQANDAFLNELTPDSLNVVSGVILQLTNGVPSEKKDQAAGNASAPATPISSPPPANCASTDSAARKSNPIPQPS